MVQAIDRLVRMRAVAALASLGMLAGCQCLWPHTSDEQIEPDRVADAEAVPACPAVTSAKAWVNRMPTIGSEPTRMIVMLDVDSKNSWFMSPLDMPAVNELILELKPGGVAVPGTVAYRQMAPAPLPDRIRILCRGSEIATVSDVMIVQ
ncbi:hypothetical protein [Hyphomonas adhaerens]|uniref:hypothetical protein n=1 Tax=Hyphomonas adhaerens TaxID=81029 RepID=UPI0023530E7F|nr:hypothetical protein [Hyphomonas adhaerens]